MHIGDLKRAVEDVVLRPDDNRLSEMEKRSTIAALDLCQVFFFLIHLNIKKIFD
ncbi:unnamed protein product [Wuchereria bancrofti]|uniref:Uncharacterized protein n=1 Tax=Wuchereria bancrofti TaxID=6293 RepID=A0A3P7E323_WUCBA|nr:unnamed protein product [Wuchereria bancrofti]